MSLTATASTDRPHSPLSDSGHHGVFSSLRTRNFRLFTTGQLFSNTGTWVQRIAQDWLVLSLTGSATAVGITTALQFLPTLLFGLFGGMIADRYPKRAVLLVTQTALGLIAGVLAFLTLAHLVEVWQVYLVAFALGVVTAVDNPTRQAFANEMVGPAQLSNAISINSSVFQLGGLIGPAISGALISAVGPGYSFLINAVSFAAPLAALLRMHPAELRTLPRDRSGPGQLGAGLRQGLRYAADEPGVRWPTVLAGVFGLFTANLPVTLAAFAHSVFHSGPGGYGLLSATVAVGSVAGALVCARLPRPRLRVLLSYGAALATLDMVSAAVSGQLAYGILLVPIGACTLLLLTSTNSMVQSTAPDAIRGRVMGIYLLVFIGGAAVGGPLLGLVDEQIGPRAGMLLAGAVPGLATVVIAAILARGRTRHRTSSSPLANVALGDLGIEDLLSGVGQQAGQADQAHQLVGRGQLGVVVGVLRMGPDELIQAVSVRADQDAPGAGPHAVEDDGRGAGRAERGAVVEALARREGIGLGHTARHHRVRAAVGADMTRHHHGHPDVRGVHAQVLDERLGEPLDRELGRGVRGLRHPLAERRPEAVDAAGVDQDALRAVDEQRQEGPGAVVNAPEVDREDPLPLLAGIGDEASAPADAGVAEHQVHVAGGVRGQDLVPEPQDLRLVGHVAAVAGDRGAAGRVRAGQVCRLRHRVGVHVAGRDRAARSGQLPDQFTAHPRAAPGYHGDLARERFHRASR